MYTPPYIPHPPVPGARRWPLVPAGPRVVPWPRRGAPWPARYQFGDWGGSPAACTSAPPPFALPTPPSPPL